jgi:hypothetical protein
MLAEQKCQGDAPEFHVARPFSYPLKYKTIQIDNLRQWQQEKDHTIQL